MTKAVLLDLGNVVLGVDFRRVFQSWADSAGVSTDRFYGRWQMDDAYKAHERGEITFDAYTRHLAVTFEVDLTHEEWETGWNDIWTSPFHSVVELLPAVSAQLPLYCFTNTNDTHTRFWRREYADALESFEHIFVSSEIGGRKPDRSAFHQVCAEMNHTPGDVLFVDDSRENVNGALRAGLNSRHVQTEAEVVDTLRRLINRG